MRKWISLLLVAALCLAGCGNTEPVLPDGFSFTYEDVEISMNAEAQPILAALGEPVSCTEEPSCAFDGVDKNYYYGSFYLTTYPEENKEYVYRLWFADDSVATVEGLRIGDAQSKAEEIYGAFDAPDSCTLTKGDTTLTVIITDGTVSAIRYDAVVE